MTEYPPIYKSREGYEAVMSWYEAAEAKLPPHDSLFVETRCGKTHILAFGDPSAPPLILVQGYGASAPLWYHQLEDFARQYRVYALDTNGHPGKSDPNPPSFLDDGYPLWLEDVLDGLQLEQARLAGVCLGGWVAIRLAIRSPERVKKLVLLSPVGLARFKIYWRSGVPLILNIGGDMEAAGQRLIVNAFTPPGSNLTFDRQLARALMLAIKHYRIGRAVGFIGDRPTPAEFARSLQILNQFVRGESARELAKISVPTLLMLGEYEAIYNPQAALRKAQKAIPDLQAEIVPRTGHAAMYDRPDYVNPRVLEFLAD